MSVYKRDGSTRWQIEFVHNGQTYRKSSKTNDKRLAEKVEEEWKRALVRQSELGEVRPLTVLQACDRWWATVVKPAEANNLSTTGKSHRSRLKAICVEFGPHTDLRQLTQVRIADWKTKLLERGLAAGTVDRSLDVLRSILLRARDEWGALSTVPVIGRLKLKVGNSRDRFLSDDEEAALLEACAAVDPDLWDVVVTAIDTGGRRGELLQVRAEEVHLRENLLALLHTKNDLPRSVPMTTRVADIASRRLALKPNRLFPYSPSTLTKAGCRIGARGAPAAKDATGMRAAWQEAKRLAGITNLKFHDLRHTFATRLVMRGASLQVVGDLLGHKDPKTTKRYAHLQPKILAAAVALLEPTSSGPAPPQVPGPVPAVSPP